MSIKNYHHLTIINEEIIAGYIDNTMVSHQETSEARNQPFDRVKKTGLNII